ncbi:hypothetical protein Taro_031894 [Colocasia esculenta]|uniref:HMA domain-containing protein n=1 Tax=Colocasia esculenta TaxID=4460 RepID=A0A843VQ09_COLES|nr:hypothetical protein [Colocasia esculenta]
MLPLFAELSFSFAEALPVENMKSNPEKAVNVVELKVYMHCRACERSVFDSLRTFKGVEAISTDMNMDKVIVKGQIDPKKVLKRLKKKTGKKAEIVVKSKDSDKAEVDGDAKASESCGDPELDGRALPHDYFEDKLMFYLDIFSDENPNACSIV